jgi:hypothetical protein
MIRVIFIASEKEKIWETDYIINCLLPEDEEKEEIFVSFEDLNNKTVGCDVLVYNCRLHTYEEIFNLVKKLNPKVIFHLSDEYYYENLGYWNELANHCKLFLRQHHHPGNVYTDNTIPMPLGYCNDAGVENKYIGMIDDREYNWSFVGDIKSDRLELVSSFSQIDNHYVGSGIDKPSMMDIYRNSIFVPCGRGNSSINCFRLYEASMAGAIPVVVASKEEIELTFMYEENPPWIFANSWQEASDICKNLLEKKDILQEIQYKLMIWWKKRIYDIRERIENSLYLKHIYQDPQFGESWFTYPNLYSGMVERFSSGSKFVEVGSWKGKSSSYMAVEIINSGKEIDFYCVDTWKGGREHQDMEDIDELYSTFIDNMKPVEEYYSPMRMTSLEAASKFEDNSLDFVFLDGSHHYEDVKDDINAWFPKIKNGGVLAGHDYTGWWSVRNAVNELIPNFTVSEECWIYDVVKTEMDDLDKLKNFPPVHFISVDDCIERRELLYEKFEQNGITNITEHVYKRYNDDDHIIESDLIDRLSIGSRGPVTSHLKAIREWYENSDDDVAFFCEDDLSFETVKYWNFTWEEFYNSLPDDWGCVQLVWLREGNDFHRFSIGLRSRCWCDWSACAYLITREHARLLIQNYYYDDVFRLNLVGEYVESREEWAKVPVVETIIFSPVTKIYGIPLFAEDIINCSSSYLSLMGNMTSGQCDEHHNASYTQCIEWWSSKGKFLPLTQLKFL